MSFVYLIIPRRVNPPAGSDLLIDESVNRWDRYIDFVREFFDVSIDRLIVSGITGTVLAVLR